MTAPADLTPEQLTRLTSPALDAVLGRPFRVLDDGFVRVVDYMGADAAIVQAARVSYGTGTKKVHEDRGLIRYLMRHRHSTPFEMCEIKLHVRVPMDAWRQWIRHRTANVNEYSTRYSVAIDAAQTTGAEEWRTQATGNRQGSGTGLDPVTGAELTREERDLQDRARAVYDHRLRLGVAREQARKDLPLSTYTEAYWKVDLHNLLHFLHLRMDPHAQLEIRRYADVIGREIVARWCPITWQAFLDYRFESLQLSRIELAVLRAVAGGDRAGATAIAVREGILPPDGNLTQRNREREELEEKLRAAGLEPPWSPPGDRHGDPEMRNSTER
jgi:thymidylate synthase (FAD)